MDTYVEPGDSITEVLDLAACGDTIHVASGVYPGSVKVSSDIVCPDGERIRVVGDDPRPQIIGEKYGIAFYGTGVDFEHLDVTTSSSDCDVDQRGVFGNGTDIDFIDIVVHDAGYDGVGTYCGAERIRLIDSEVRDNGLDCIDDEGNAQNGDGVDLFACRDCLVDGSYIHGNNLYAIQLKGGIADTAVRNSLLTSVAGFNIVVGRPGDTADCPGTDANAERITVENNVLWNTYRNGWQIAVVDVTDLVVTHNTLVVTDTEDSPDGLVGGFISFEADVSGTRGARFQNNIFANQGMPSYDPICDYGGDGCNAGFDLSNFVADHNLYWDTTELTEPPDGSADSMLADPRFTAFPDELTLGEGSPAEDAGIDLGEPYEGDAPDLGAFERAAAKADEINHTEKTGCACASAGASPTWAALLVAGVITWRRRSRLSTS